MKKKNILRPRFVAANHLYRKAAVQNPRDSAEYGGILAREVANDLQCYSEMLHYFGWHLPHTLIAAAQLELRSMAAISTNSALTTQKSDKPSEVCS